MRLNGLKVKITDAEHEFHDIEGEIISHSLKEVESYQNTITDNQKQVVSIHKEVLLIRINNIFTIAHHDQIEIDPEVIRKYEKYLESE